MTDAAVGYKYSIFDVFTPTTPAKETFVERGNVQDLLVDAFKTPGKQIIVYGHSGSGKSTLIERKLFELYEKHITTACMRGMTFESVLLDAFDQLDLYYESLMKQSSVVSANAELRSQWATIAAAKSKAHELQNSRLLPPQLTAQSLARFLGEVKACWVLEDFHKLEEPEKIRLAQAMKMFMDMARHYPELKAVAVGAVATAREVVQYDQEMRGRVSEIEVPLMTDAELKEIIRIGASKLNIEFSKGASASIVLFSNGLASTCHQLCLNACIAHGIESERGDGDRRLSDESFKRSITMYAESASDSIRQRFEKATKVKRRSKFNTYEVVLRHLSKFGPDGTTIGELTRSISEDGDDCDINNLGRYIALLQQQERGGVLSFNADSGKYFVSDPFVMSYMQAYFESRSNRQGDLGDTFVLDNERFARFITDRVLKSILEQNDTATSMTALHL